MALPLSLPPIRSWRPQPLPIVSAPLPRRRALLNHAVPALPCPGLALTLLAPCTGPALTYNRLQYSSLYCTALYSAASRHQHGSPKTLKHPDTPPHPPTSSPLPPPRVPAIPPATHHLLLPPHCCPQDACLTQTASFSPTLVVVWPCLIVAPSASPRPAVRVRFLRDSRSIQPVHLPHPRPHPHHPVMPSSPARSTTLLILLLWGVFARPLYTIHHTIPSTVRSAVPSSHQPSPSLLGAYAAVKDPRHGTAWPAATIPIGGVRCAIWDSSSIGNAM